MKIWIKTNLSKITLALALTGAVSGVTGLIIGSLAQNKTNNLTYFLNHNHIAVWGNTTIWKHEFEGGGINLYFSVNKAGDNDIKWDGIYPKGYFNN